MANKFEPSNANLDRFILEPEHVAPSDWINPELVEQAVSKPWTVVLCYDHETNQYQSMIPELGIGTMGDSRADALSAMEDCLATYVEAVLETGGQITEPPATDIEEFLPKSQAKLQKIGRFLSTGGLSILERNK